MGWYPKGKPWAEWKAKELNRLFQEQGLTGEQSRITAATVRHGEQSDRRESLRCYQIENRNKRNS
jgi:hypothetical protein